MSIRDDFFAAQAKASLWDVAVSIKRGNPLPLDANSVFKAYGTVGGADYAGSLLEYVTSNPVAYPGQICAVVGADATTVYYLDQNLAIKPVGIIPTGDNKTIEVTADGAISLLGAAGAANGTLPMIDAETGKLTWKTLQDIGAGDGNDNTTYEFAFADQKITITPKFNGQPVMEGEGEEAKQVVHTLDLSTFVTETELADAIKDFVTTDTTYSVKTGEKVLKLEGTEFSTVASLKYVPAVAADAEAGTEAVPAKIQLCGIGDAVVSEIDATPFIRDGMLDDVAYNAETNTLTFTWNTESGAKTDTVVLSDIIEPYTAGNGLELSGNQFAVKRNADSENFLTVDENGVKVSGIAAAIEAAEGRAATDAQTKANTAKTEALTAVANDYYKKTDVYTKGETDSKIDEKIASVTGGESAADVKLALESYRNAANTEIWGADAANWTVTTEEDGKTKVTYTPQYGNKSRIDLLEEAVDALEEVGAQANVIEAVVGAADNRLAITTENKVVTIDDANLRTDIAAALKAGQDAGAAAGVNANAIAGHDTRISALETAKGTQGEAIEALQQADITLGGKITALEATVNNETSGVAANYAAITKNTSDIAALVAQDKTHTEEIATLKTTVAGHGTDIGNINAALANIYTKNDVYSKGEIDGKVTTINEALANKLEAAALASYAKTDDVAAKYATISALNEVSGIASANAAALAILHGNVEGDKAKSVRAIAKEEVAVIVGAAPEAMDTLEEVAAWIGSDTTGAAAMAGDIAALKETTAKHTTAIEETLPAAIAAAEAAAKKHADDTMVKADGTSIVNNEGTFSVGEVAINKLVNVEGFELILNGGKAANRA